MNPHYNPLSFLFYPLILAVLFAGIYFIWENNPSLLDQLSLIEKQSKKERRDSFLVQTNPLSTEDPSRFSPSSFEKLQPGDARHYPISFRVNHRFKITDDYAGPTADSESEFWVADQKGLLFQSEKKIRFVNHSGEEDWEFILEDSEFCPGTPALSEDFVYLCTLGGDVMALYRDNGRIAWLLRSPYKFWRAPILTDKQLLVFDKGKEYHHVISLKRETGEEDWKMRTLTQSLNSDFAFSKDFEKLVFASSESWVYAYNLKNQTKLWELELSQVPGDSPAIYQNQVYVSGSEGMLTSIDLKSGKLDWEYDLKKPLTKSITVLPQLGIGTIVDSGGYLHVMDLKAGKRKWRYNMKTNSKAHELHAIRFSSSSTAKLNMSAESKGWSFWGACGKNQVCAFEPFKGYMLRRFELPGPMAAAPILIDKGQELLLTYLEGKTLKFLKFIEKTKLDMMKEAADAQATASADSEPIPAPPADATVDNVEPEN